MFKKVLESLREAFGQSGVADFDTSDTPQEKPVKPAVRKPVVPLKAMRNMQKPIANKILPGVHAKPQTDKQKFAQAKTAIGKSNRSYFESAIAEARSLTEGSGSRARKHDRQMALAGHYDKQMKTFGTDLRSVARSSGMLPKIKARRFAKGEKSDPLQDKARRYFSASEDMELNVAKRLGGASPTGSGRSEISMPGKTPFKTTSVAGGPLKPSKKGNYSLPAHMRKRMGFPSEESK